MTWGTDSRLMHLALEAASEGLFRTSPNPRVGCVIASEAGDVLGVGSTQQAGGPHAEVMALRDAAKRGLNVNGATAFVTLEPCSHHGRTGPCCDALIEAGIRRVVASSVDPNPLVAGRGVRRLRESGVSVDIGLGEAETRELNIGFFSRMIRGTPWVRVKSAASLDGRTALDSGESQWITGPDAREDGQRWRARACAVLTGIGTVLADDPRLDVRSFSTPRQPTLIVVDSALRVPLTASLFLAPRPVVIYTAANQLSKIAELQAQGVTVVQLPSTTGQVDLGAMLRDLGTREINELHVEAGAVLTGALWENALADELLLYLAPTLLGPGKSIAQLTPLEQLANARPLEFTSIERIGADVRILARPLGRASF